MKNFTACFFIIGLYVCPAAFGALQNMAIYTPSKPFLSAYSQTNPRYYLDNPVSWAGTDGTYTASASYQYYSSGYSPGLPFAASGLASGPKDGWISLCGTAAWLRLKLPYPKTMKRFRLYTRANGNSNSGEAPNNFTVSASNDGTNWTVVYSNTGTPPGWKNGNFQASDWMDVQNPAPYLYYQLNVKNCAGTLYVGIGRWEIENIGNMQVIKFDNGIKTMQLLKSD